uniref:Invertase inhibitor n=1 Tax=Dendrobium catenatum TaxID=906689 RepID=A0A808KXH3_9ASPA|nr:invertase inhibitor [Dendrobium catenatum]
MARKNNICLLFPLLVLPIISIAADAAGGPSTVCSFLGASYVSYDYCMAVLSSDPRSSTADPHGLALITGDLALANATAVRSTIKLLLNNSSDPFIHTCLSHCRKIYDGAISDVRKAAHATARRNYAAAEELFDGVLNAPADCEATFAARPVASSPIVKEDNEFSDIACLGRAINNYLK